MDYFSDLDSASDCSTLLNHHHNAESSPPPQKHCILDIEELTPYTTVDGAEDRAPINETQPPVKEPTRFENIWLSLKAYSVRIINSLIFFQWIAAAYVLYFVYHGHHCSSLVARYLFGVFTTSMTLGFHGLIAVYFPGPTRAP